MWMNKTIRDINKEMHDVEEAKKLKAEDAKRQAKQKAYDLSKAQSKTLNPKMHSKLSRSHVWNRTEEEDDALAKFRTQMRGYRGYTDSQRTALSFSNQSGPEYIKFDNPKEVESYVTHSEYWHMRDVLIQTTDQKSAKIVFAENRDMKCIICEYLGKLIITTQSSFENILLETEGKPLINSTLPVVERRTGQTFDPIQSPIVEDTQVRPIDVAAQMDRIADFNKPTKKGKKKSYLDSMLDLL